MSKLTCYCLFKTTVSWQLTTLNNFNEVTTIIHITNNLSDYNKYNHGLINELFSFLALAQNALHRKYITFVN